MSYVTSCVIVTSISEPLEKPIAAWKFNDLVGEQRFTPCKMEDAGGYKAIEMDVYACAYNFGPEPEQVLDWFAELPWTDENATLTVSGNDYHMICVVQNGTVVHRSGALA